MKRILIFLLITVFGGYELCFSQSYSYEYDVNGNRKSRIIPSFKSAGSLDEKKEALEYSQKKLEDLEIYLYPNPTKGELTVMLKNLDESRPSVIYLYDNSGKLLDTYSNLKEVNFLDLSGLPHGVYLLRIMVGDQKHEWSIIKE